MLKRHLSDAIFWSATALSLITVALVWVLGNALLIVIGLSVLFNLGSVYWSEHGGFLRSRETRRIPEAARRFSMGQALIIFALVMVQCGVGAYMLLL